MDKSAKLAMFPGAQQPDLTSKQVSQNGKGEPGSRQIIKTLTMFRILLLKPLVLGIPHLVVSWNRGTLKSSISSWDFHWNKPSSYWGTPMTMETPILRNTQQIHPNSDKNVHSPIRLTKVGGLLVLFDLHSFCRGGDHAELLLARLWLDGPSAAQVLWDTMG